MIYLDNAATSWPKPPEVLRAMTDFMERRGGNPGRSGHQLSIEAGRAVYDAREAVAELFHVSDPLRIIFTLNATHALNIALSGLVRPGDKVVTTGIEHNSVMRPLKALQKHGAQVTVAPCLSDTTLDFGAMEQAVTPGTRLVAVTHASNVTGALLPLAEIGRMAHAAGALFLVDAAQSGGCVPLDVPALGIDLLAFSGHKGLLGPAGTGGLVIGPKVDTAAMEPLLRGGTGSRSEFHEQPEDLPDKFESGTPNGPGLAGLAAGVRHVLRIGPESVRAQELELAGMLLGGLAAAPGVKVYGPRDPARRIAVVSFTLEGRSVSEAGLRLDDEFGVMCRVGLHCAPSAHRTLGTFPEGTIRFAPGLMTAKADIVAALRAVEAIARG